MIYIYIYIYTYIGLKEHRDTPWLPRTPEIWFSLSPLLLHRHRQRGIGDNGATDPKRGRLFIGWGGDHDLQASSKAAWTRRWSFYLGTIPSRDTSSLHHCGPLCLGVCQAGDGARTRKNGQRGPQVSGRRRRRMEKENPESLPRKMQTNNRSSGRTIWMEALPHRLLQRLAQRRWMGARRPYSKNSPRLQRLWTILCRRSWGLWCPTTTVWSSKSSRRNWIACAICAIASSQRRRRSRPTRFVGSNGSKKSRNRLCPSASSTRARRPNCSRNSSSYRRRKRTSRTAPRRSTWTQRANRRSRSWWSTNCSKRRRRSRRRSRTSAWSWRWRRIWRPSINRGSNRSVLWCKEKCIRWYNRSWKHPRQEVPRWSNRNRPMLPWRLAARHPMQMRSKPCWTIKWRLPRLHVFPLEWPGGQGKLRTHRLMEGIDRPLEREASIAQFQQEGRESYACPGNWAMVRRSAESHRRSSERIWRSPDDWSSCMLWRMSMAFVILVVAIMVSSLSILAFVFCWLFGGAHVKCQPSCLKICKRQFRSSRRSQHNKFCRLRWKGVFFTFLLLHHDLKLAGATISNLSHAVSVTQPSYEFDFDEASSAFMQLPGTSRSMSSGPEGFPHLGPDLVRQHFLKWEAPVRTVLRGRGHQYRCFSEYIFATRIASVDWTGWCVPNPSIKKFKDDSVILATDIIRRGDIRDVALDVQVRQGVPATVSMHASVMRVGKRLTRPMFVDKLLDHMEHRMGLQRIVDHVFYKGRIWPEGSTVDVKVNHCDTFVVMSHWESEDIEDPQVQSTLGGDPNACPSDLDTRIRPIGLSNEEETADDRHSPVNSDTSFDVETFGLFTFMVGTDGGVKRYDTSFKIDITNDMILHFVAEYLRCDVVMQEITSSHGFAVDKQRIFIILDEDSGGSFMTLQRRFHGYEQETFRIVSIRGESNFEDYIKHFLPEDPIEIFLGAESWTSTPYKIPQPGSLITALYPDPEGGAYRFEATAQLPGLALLQISMSRWRGIAAPSKWALGNVEDATWDPLLEGVVNSTDATPCIDFFERLSPPGNPNSSDGRSSLWPERSSVGNDVVVEQLMISGSPIHLDSSDDEDHHTRIEGGCSSHHVATIPHGIEEVLKLLVPWQACPLPLLLPSDLQLPAIADQYVRHCVLGWEDRIQSLHIYTDGSCKTCDDERHASFAFSVFGYDMSIKPHHFFVGWFANRIVTDPGHPHYVGASAHSAKEAETSALLWANIWLLQSGLRIPVFFHYDALSVGNAMTGLWNVRPDWQQGCKLRELVLFSQAIRVGCHHHYEHCKAHSLQPGNELTDSLAKYACDCTGMACEVDPNITWGPIFQAEDVRLSWAWWNVSYFFSREYPDKSDGLLCVAPPRPQNVRPHISSLEPERHTHNEETWFGLRVGTYNTMTLHSRSDDGTITIESCRAAMLRKQLSDAGYHIVGLQETRCNLQTVFVADDYIRFTSGSDLSRPGHWGCEIWFRRGAKVAQSHSLHLPFDAKALTVLHAHPRLLVIHARIGGHALVVVSAHAPHEGASTTDKDQWWSMFNQVCSQYNRLGRWIVMCDFNARLGVSSTTVVGDLVFDEHDNDNGERMVTACVDHGLWIPSTSSEHHDGPSYTWSHPKGNQIRLDYILLSACDWHSVNSFVDFDIVTSNSVRDHELVGMDLQWCQSSIDKPIPRVNYDWDRMHTPEGRALLHQVIQALPVVDWQTDVHQHWQMLEDALHQGLSRAFPAVPRPVRADIFTASTWELRDLKRRLKSNLFHLDDALDDVYVWISWRTWKLQTTIMTSRRSICPMLILIECMRLFIVDNFRLTAKKLRKSLSHDKAMFLEKVIHDAGQCKGADIFKALQPLRIGSAVRKRGIQALPCLINKEGIVALDENARDKMWNDHCAAMEAGVETTAQRLLQRTRNRHEKSFTALGSNELHLEQVPSLVELEGCFRRIKPRKAAGADGIRSDICAIAAAPLARKFHPLLAKMFLRGEEPLQMKGGLVISAYKSGSQTSVENYRSLLLSSHLGKALRRTIRQRLVPFYADNAQEFHCSVKQGGSVSHASQGLRLALSAARSRHMSSGVLFLDVKAAYYRVVRELVVDMHDDAASLQRLPRYFNLENTNEVELLTAISDGSVADALQIPQHLQTLLRESLSNTWFVTEQRNTLFECLAGSRPGDGLADVVFALIFRKILSCIQDDFHEQFGAVEPICHPDYDFLEDIPPSADIPPFLDIVWADDLAVVITHPSAEQMIERLRFVISRTFHHCLRHALIPNLKKGKTEVMLFIRGAGSRAIRSHFFNMEDPFLEVAAVPDDFSRVIISAGYKHLGSRIHLGRGLLPEIKARLGAATAVYRKHRRVIFQNRQLALEKRRYLFTTMVLSIVRYNTGTWGPLSVGDRKYFVTRMMNMYRGLLRAETPDPQLRLWNNNMVLAAVGLPDPLSFLHEARLSFAISASKSGPKLLWTLAAAEAHWLSALRDSKQWLHQQLRGQGPDRYGTMWAPDYTTELTQRPDVFKRWIRKASAHARLQLRLNTAWTEWHHDFLLSLIHHGLQIPFPWPDGADLGDTPKAEACLQCHRLFSCRAAWSVHAFKVHQRVNDKRALINSTRCEVCMKEFRTEDRLQRHLNYKTSCAVQLRQAGMLYPIQPGINSIQQRRPSDFPIPIMTSEGPHREWQPARGIEWGNGLIDDFVEQLLDCAMGLHAGTSFLVAVELFKELFNNRNAAFSDLVRSFKYFRRECGEHWDDIRGDDTQPFNVLDDTLQRIERHLHIRWFFSEEECKSLPDAEALRGAAWNYCNNSKMEVSARHWRATLRVPRFGYRQLTFLHLFAGEARQGDLQEALLQMDIPSGFTRVVLAVDIIYDAVRADLSVKKTQEKWLGYIRKGLIDAIFAGPPCESWSKSRQQGGVPEVCSGDGGPRVLRTAARPQGLVSLCCREIEQLLLANALLLFTLLAFLEMLIIGKFAMVEHPSMPTDSSEIWLPSIWRLFVVRCLQAHPGTQTVLIHQGYFGAKSPKPTTLMFSCDGSLSVSDVLWERRTQQTLPQALRMGKQNGEYATASLKNYPTGLCRALSYTLSQWLTTHAKHSDVVLPSDHADLREFSEYVQHLLINFNFAAQRGADCAL